MVEIVFGSSIVARGEPGDMALFMCIFIESMNKFKQAEADEKVRKELDLEMLFKNVSIEELIKREREDGDK